MEKLPKKDPIETITQVKRALLVGIIYPGQDEAAGHALLDELKELTENLKIEVLDSKLVHLKQAKPQLLLGSGKADELVALADSLNCEAIIFDETLTPGQQRNWETLSGLYVMDRQEVILEIFARRAQTKEAVLQVELAQMEYTLPRLRRAWTHLSRQRGGRVTMRGGGEKQLEIDQRLVRKRISQLKKELKEVLQHRDVQRKRRLRIPVPTGAIVGYTNAGKSSLLNMLTQAKVVAEDKLFATLDPTTRRLELPSGQTFLLTDTVGFIRKLPHKLVDAFKATLEETVHADIIIHVIDGSNPEALHHWETTQEVLKELGVLDKPTLTVINKCDLGIDPVLFSALQSRVPNLLRISARTGEGSQALLEAIEALIEEQVVLAHLLIPHDRYDLIHALHELGAIKKQEVRDEGVFVIGNIPKRFIAQVEPFDASKKSDSKDVFGG